MSKKTLDELEEVVISLVEQKNLSYKVAAMMIQSSLNPEELTEESWMKIRPHQEILQNAVNAQEFLKTWERVKNS